MVTYLSLVRLKTNLNMNDYRMYSDNGLNNKLHENRSSYRGEHEHYSFLDSADRGSRFVNNVGTWAPNHMASHPKLLKSWHYQTVQTGLVFTRHFPDAIMASIQNQHWIVEHECYNECRIQWHVIGINKQASILLAIKWFTAPHIAFRNDKRFLMLIHTIFCVNWHRTISWNQSKIWGPHSGVDEDWGQLSVTTLPIYFYTSPTLNVRHGLLDR